MRGGGCVRRAAAGDRRQRGLCRKKGAACQGCYGAVDATNVACVGTLAIRQTMRNEYRFTDEPVQKIPNDKNRYR